MKLYTLMHCCNKAIFFVVILMVPVFSSAQTWTGSSNTDWNTPANWNTGIVPNSATAVIIPGLLTRYPIISTGADAFAASVTINSGASLTMDASSNLTISDGGKFINSGTFSPTGSGAVIFTGKGTISGVTSFKNVTINGAVDFGTSSTITGTLLLNPGGAASGFSTHSIIYTSSSTLIYNETITTGNEWDSGGSATITPGVGIPENVMLESGTVTIPNTGGTNRALAGNLTIISGTTLKMTTGSRDLFIAGNWINNGGSFIANGRKVTFNGASDTQTVSGNTTFYDLSLDNSTFTTDFASSITTINHEFRVKSGTMDGGTSTFIFSGTSCTLEGANAKKFYNVQITPGSILSDLTASAGDTHISNSFTNNGTFNQVYSHTAYFDKAGGTVYLYGTGSTYFGKVTIGMPVGSPAILNAGSHSFTITGNTLQFNISNSSFAGGTSTVTFALTTAGTVSIKNALGVTGTLASFNNVSINATGSSVATAVDFGIGIASISNSLTINDNGSVITNGPLYGLASTLIYNSSVPAIFSTGKEWNSNNASPGLGVPQNVSVTNGSSVIIQGDRTVPGTLNLTAGVLDINDKTLTVNGSFTGTGGYLKGSLLSNLVTTASGTIYFKPNDYITNNITNNYLKTLTLNSAAASISIGDSLNIASGIPGSNGTVIVTNGTLHANGNLVLKSDSNGTARVGYSTGSIMDSVTVERYIPPLRAWRFLGIPFNSSTQTIRDAWQEGVNNYGLGSSYMQNPHPGFGTEITGNNYSDLGYDFNDTRTALVPSYKVWDSSKNEWNIVEPPTISTGITDYPAYCIFVRGSRAIDLSQLTSAVPDATVLRAKGILNQKGSNYSKQYNGGKGKTVFVGNPYASSVNIYKLIHERASGFIPDLFYLWDPKRTGSGTKNVGGYVTYDEGVLSPASSPSYPIADSALIVESGEAFMLRLDSASSTANLNFTETDKVATENNVFGFGDPQTHVKTPPVIYTNLLVPAANGLFLADGIAAGFENSYSEKVDDHDALKLWNFDENISLYRDDKYLTIEFRPIPKLTDTLFYRLYLRQQPYTLQIFSQNSPVNIPTKAWLIDDYLGTETAVNLDDTTLYNFTPNSDTLSYRNRFMLVFNKQFLAVPNSLSRINNQDIAGVSGVAKSVILKASGVHIFPNPVSDGKAMLQFNNMDKGVYDITVYNSQAQKILNTTFSHTGGDNMYCLLLNPAFASGLYSVAIINKNSKETINLKLVIGK
ncbi:MAG: T9SS type A sorting domain-containing protein [Parafilimonas sp.]